MNHVPDDFTADFLARRESYSDVRRWKQHSRQHLILILHDEHTCTSMSILTQCSIAGLFHWPPSECKQTAGSLRFKPIHSHLRSNSNSFHPSLSENLKPSGNRSSFRRRHRLVGAELIAAWKVMNMFLTDSTITKYLRGLPVETDFDVARVRTLVKLQVVAFGQQETSWKLIFVEILFQQREERLPGLEESGRREELGQILRLLMFSLLLLMLFCFFVVVAFIVDISN